MNLDKDELVLLNSKYGLRYLFDSEELDVIGAIKQAKYIKRLNELQAELIRLQTWVIKNDEKVVIIFEGRDAAGKGGAIRRITEHINPRHFEIVALDKPTEDERKQWYFQRYINHLPSPGNMVFFDRSWYNRAMVEPVHGFCTEEEYEIFMEQVNEFEKMIVRSGIHLVKFYFSISKEEQKKRFVQLEKSPLKRWKMTPLDREARELWNKYTVYKDRMFNQTDTDHAPWYIIDANNKKKARIKALEHILDLIFYKK